MGDCWILAKLRRKYKNAKITERSESIQFIWYPVPRLSVFTSYFGNIRASPVWYVRCTLYKFQSHYNKLHTINHPFEEQWILSSIYANFAYHWIGLLDRWIRFGILFGIRQRMRVFSLWNALLLLFELKTMSSFHIRLISIK